MTNFGERFNIHFDLSIEPENSKGLNVKNRRKPKQDLVTGQTGSLGALASKNYANHAVNWLTSGRLTFAIQRFKARRSQQMKEMAAQSREDFDICLIWFNSPILTTKMPQELDKTSTKTGLSKKPFTISCQNPRRRNKFTFSYDALLMNSKF